MHTHPAPLPSSHERSLSRDRAILALASALCGAIAAAGIAAVAIAGQLQSRQQESSMQQATDTLRSANLHLGRARAELLQVRATAATCPSPAPLTEQALTSAAAAGSTMITHVGITCPEEHVCQVHREVIAELLDNPRPIERAARVIPSVRDGEFLGVKLYGLRSGSPLKLLGFRNGDLVTAINGENLDSMERSLRAIQRIQRGEPRVRVDVERKGELLHKRFEVI